MGTHKRIHFIEAVIYLLPFIAYPFSALDQKSPSKIKGK